MYFTIGKEAEFGDKRKLRVPVLTFTGYVTWGKSFSFSKAGSSSLKWDNNPYLAWSFWGLEIIYVKHLTSYLILNGYSLNDIFMNWKSTHFNSGKIKTNSLFKTQSYIHKLFRLILPMTIWFAKEKLISKYLISNLSFAIISYF